MQHLWTISDFVFILIAYMLHKYQIQPSTIKYTTWFQLSYSDMSLLCVNLSFSLSILAEKLQQPSIQIVTSTSVESGCLMVVNCSSLDEGVNLSWRVEPVSALTINKSHPSDSSAQLFAFVNTKENFASFTCISSRDTESVSSKPVTPKCESKICGKLLNGTHSVTNKYIFS